MVELTDRQKDKVGGFSHGMRQRLGVAGALLRDPRLLLLDEPATGLDPGGMRDMRALVARLSQAGTTVLLSSHLLNEVEELCNRVAIVRTGSIVYEGRLTDLKATVEGEWRLRTTDDGRALEVCRAQRGSPRCAATAWSSVSPPLRRPSSSSRSRWWRPAWRSAPSRRTRRRSRICSSA